jgi:cytochrome c553
MIPRSILPTLFASACVAIAGDKSKPVDVSKLPLPVPRKVAFEQEVYPILKEYCIKCHGPEKQKGKYRCDTKAGAFKETDYGPTIVAGNSEKSSLIHMVCGLVDEMMMPPPSDKPGESERLSTAQVGVLRAWIDQGATWPDGPIQDFVKPVTFEADVKPIFATSCAPCHGGADTKGEFDCTSLAGVMKGGKVYGKIAFPKDVKKSALITIISGLDEDLPQPQKHKLGTRQIETVKRWIELGAQ